MRPSQVWLCVPLSLACSCAQQDQDARSGPVTGEPGSTIIPASPPRTEPGSTVAGSTIAASPPTTEPGSTSTPTPSPAPTCRLPDQPGFNHYTVAAVNDTRQWPRNGAFPYCWEKRGDRCHGHWGMVHDASYGGSTIFHGGGDCYCSGHTLEIFLQAYRLWQLDHGAPESAPYEVGGFLLLPGDIERYGEYGGAFYQLWQGFGFVDEASSAAAFDTFGIGIRLALDRWDSAMPGDYVNFSRKNGTGHAVIFVSWILRDGVRTGIRYYACNSKGDSCPDPADPANEPVHGGPSFHTERFADHGGQIIASRMHIGRPSLPTTPNRTDSE